MKDGDICGFSAFNGDAGVVKVVREGKKFFVVADEENVELSDNEKAVTNVRVKEVFRKELSKATSVYFRIDANFRPGTDLATLYYSIDGNNWTPLLKDYKMIFDYRRFFMGTKFAIFNYATKKKGGWVDVDWFHYEKKVED